MILVDSSVREDQDIRAFVIGSVSRQEQPFYRLVKTGVLVVKNRDNGDLEAADFHVFELEDIGGGKDRVVNLENLAVRGLFLQDISRRTDINGGRGDDLLADSVDRRICYLREELLEVVEQRLRLVRERGDRLVGAHRGDRLAAVFRHRQDRIHHVLIRVAERLLELSALLAVMSFDLLVRDLEVAQLNEV